MNHIVIIGFMGSGKTRVGKRLAKDFNLPFVDVDRVVSKKMNLTMKEIFDRFGEPFYRALETTVIKALIDDPEQKIISLGSGLPMDGDVITLGINLIQALNMLDGAGKIPCSINRNIWVISVYFHSKCGSSVCHHCSDGTKTDDT